MADGAYRNSTRRSSEAGGPCERFAAFIEADRDQILTSYATTLGAGNDTAAEPYRRDQALKDAAKILSDVEASMKSGAARLGRPERPDGASGSADQGSQPSPVDMLRALSGLSDLSIAAFARHLADDPELLPCFVTALLALNQSIGRRLREAIHAHTGSLLERVDRAHAAERQRVARDLHDRLGEGLSSALRQLELHEITANGDSSANGDGNSPWAATAIDTLIKSMQTLRAVTSGLRQDSIRSLETALVQYIDLLAADADVRLRVSGDETWASPLVLEETFLILREAIRNALRHGNPQRLMIGVALAPDELHAWVEDDGHGFDADEVARRNGAGVGLSSVRERAGLIGGRLTITSAPDQGTQVELFVPLPGPTR